jgi:hypothetical protein
MVAGTFFEHPRETTYITGSFINLMAYKCAYTVAKWAKQFLTIKK